MTDEQLSQYMLDMQKAEMLPADMVLKQAMAVMDSDPGKAASLLLLVGKKCASLALECCTRMSPPR